MHRRFLRDTGTAPRYAGRMNADADFEIFLVTAPGLESVLADEAKAHGFKGVKPGKGGVRIQGGWPDVWRANLELRGPARVLARIASFRAMHLAQLDKRAHKVAWGEYLRTDAPFRVEASCTASRIYHQGAAAQRIEKAIRDVVGAPVEEGAELCIKARIDDDLCTISIDTTGESLHKRGHKAAVAKAPMRENLAALFLRQCGYDGTAPVLDPMCGSGTFVLEAAEIAAGLKPGRSRRFAFEQLATFDNAAWQKLRAAGNAKTPDAALRFHGRDRDAGAIRMSRANAERAGIASLTDFAQRELADLTPPPGPPGLVIVNPPYGTRIGEKKALLPLYRKLGETLRTRFAGWRVGVVTNDADLAAACGLPFAPPFGPVSHGGLRVSLYLTAPLQA
jgi:putative N6-adenine-specific DNA methylase